MARKGKARPVQALGDVARLVDPDEEEWHALLPRLLQRGQTVRRLLEADAELAGEAFHMNWTVSYEVLENNKLRVGINGYWLLQTTDPQIDGVSVPGQRERVLALGPGLLSSFSEKTFFFCNAYFETDVHNRPEGMSLVLRYVAKF